MGPEQDVVPRVQGFQSRALVPVLLLLLAMRPAQPYPLPLSSRRRSPPYVTATESSLSNAGGAAASASAGSGPRSATAGMGNGTVVPFTGDAVKAAGSAGGAIFALVLGVVAAAVWVSPLRHGVDR